MTSEALQYKDLISKFGLLWFQDKMVRSVNTNKKLTIELTREENFVNGTQDIFDVLDQHSKSRKDSMK